VLNRQQYALLVPPGGSAVAASLKSQLEKRPPADAQWKARLQWQLEHTDDFCLFWVNDGICEPVDWDRDYNTLLSVASTWMESKVERSLSARERRWRYAQASDRQVDGLARWGVIPSVEWLHSREREVGIRLLSGTASDLLSYKIALSAYSIAGFVLPPTTEQSENAESRFRRLLREQRSYRDSR
jgi:hypothetical protein